VIFAGSQVVRSAGTAISTAVSGGTEIVSSGGTTSNTLLVSGQETVLRGGHASGTIITSGGYELVGSGGTAVATKISGGTLEVAAGGSASGVVFSRSGGMLQVDSGGHVSGAISGFHLGDEIDLRGLAYVSSSSTLSWKQKTSGANASGTLTVEEGTHSTTLTLVGSYTSGNFSVTSDGHGGTLITDPPVSDGGIVISGAGTSGGMADIAPGSASVISSSAISGGYEFHASGGAVGDTDSGGSATGVFFSGGGMVQLDALLSRFAGVISGFDLGNEVDLPSLGFGSSSSAASWMPQASGADAEASSVDKSGLFSLTLLGQYGANFSAGADDHGGSVITDPAASGSVAPTPLIAHQ
jgi:autotransporter passenger strand-loop-strand repeat protein